MKIGQVRYAARNAAEAAVALIAEQYCTGVARAVQLTARRFDQVRMDGTNREAAQIASLDRDARADKTAEGRKLIAL